MNLPHVFAKGSAAPSDLGYPITVRQGSCWLADDPLVQSRPDLFTEDCRYALGRDQSWSGEPPACMMIPPGGEDPALADDGSSAAMTSRVRSRSQAERARAGR